MATKFARTAGGYEKKTYDSGTKESCELFVSPGQDKKKFGNYAGEKSVKPYSGVEHTKQKLSQKINTPMDSGEGRGRQKNEGGSETSNIHPTKGKPSTGNKAKAPARGDM